MHTIKLRKRNPVTYYPHKEAAFDKYVFCEKCCDFVFEYCSIHGPLLIIPDKKVSLSPIMPGVPRAALTLPRTFLHLAPSNVPGAGIGVFSLLTLPRGVRFGPYRGVKTTELRSLYSWQIYNNGVPSHLVDASDAGASNWMRYVNCSRHWDEQNLIAYQYQGQIYYRTIKVIPPFTELMVFYGAQVAATLYIDLHRYNMDGSFQKVIDQSNQERDNKTQLIEIILSPNINTASLDESDSTSVEASPLKSVEENHTEKIECEEDDGCDTKFGEDTDQGSNEMIFDEEVLESHEESSIEEIECSVFEENSEQSESFVEQKWSFESNHQVNYITNNINNYSCQICSKTFNKLYGIKRHCMTHKTAPNHIIPIQIRTQSCEHSYICNICTYPCDSKKNLIRHKLKVHIVRKCPFCGIEFFNKTNYGRHLARHTEKKIYNCNKCSFKTNFVQMANKHCRSHMVENVYKCDGCSFKTLRRDSIVRHLRRIHSKKINTNKFPSHSDDA